MMARGFDLTRPALDNGERSRPELLAPRSQADREVVQE
jgi:hypothetical protein